MTYSDDPTRMEEPEEPGSGSLSPGQRFGQYRVIRLLGRGGMGEVYQVRHQVLEKDYALKLIHPEVVGSEGALERFRAEARIMAQMDHPHIVKVDDFGTESLPDDGGVRHWLRMELIAARLRSESYDGSPSAGADSEQQASLADYVKASSEKLPEAEVREIVRQVLEGLRYAHGKGLVHRDLKPANILLAGASGNSGQIKNRQTVASDVSPGERPHESSSLIAKICDFGLVKVAGEDWLRSQVEKSVAQSMSISEQATRVTDGSQGTSTRALLGTYAYMSPEQKRGEEVDARSDLYAVGLMAYQMLTGEESLGLKAPSRLNPQINPAWDEWIEKATESKKDHRFANAGEMLERLPHVGVGVSALDRRSLKSEGGLGSSSVRRGLKGRPDKSVAPTKGWFWKVSGVLVLLGALGVAIWKYEPRPESEPPPQIEKVEQRQTDTEVVDSAAERSPVSTPTKTEEEIEWERLRQQVAQIDDYLENVKPLLELPFILEQEGVAELKQKRIDARATLDQLSERYRERHPRMIEAQEHYSETEGQLIEVVNRAVAKIRQEAEAAKANFEFSRLSPQEREEVQRRETLSKGRAEAERLLDAGDLSGADEALSLLEADGFPVEELRRQWESLTEARAVRVLAGQAEAERERWRDVLSTDGEGLQSRFRELDAVWRTAERASNNQLWGEARHDYDSVLEMGRELRNAVRERDQAREIRSEMNRTKEQVVGPLADIDDSEFKEMMGDTMKAAKDLENEGDQLYADGAFRQAGEKWVEASIMYGHAAERTKTLLAWNQAKTKWQSALDEVDPSFLQKWASSEWEDAQAKAQEAEHGSSDLQASMQSYDSATQLLAQAVSQAKEQFQLAEHERLKNKAGDPADFDEAVSQIDLLKLENGWIVYPSNFDYTTGDRVGRPMRGWVVCRFSDNTQHQILEMITLLEGFFLPGSGGNRDGSYYINGLTWIDYFFAQEAPPSLDQRIMNSINNALSSSHLTPRGNLFKVSEEVVIHRREGTTISSTPPPVRDAMAIAIGITNGIGFMAVDANTQEQRAFYGGMALIFNALLPWIYFEPSNTPNEKGYPLPESEGNKALQGVVREAALSIAAADSVSSRQARILKERFIGAYPPRGGRLSPEGLFQILETMVEAREILSNRNGRLNQHLYNEAGYPIQIIRGGR